MTDRLLNAIRAKDYRAAFKAIAALRGSPQVLPPENGKDEQREFQLKVARLVAQRGVSALPAAWATLGPEQWRAALISEIGQFCDLWAEEALVELAIAALQDESRGIQRNAVWTLLGWLRERSPRELKAAKTEAQRRFAAAQAALRGWITPPRRARLTQAYGTLLWGSRRERHVALGQITESVGYTARASDTGIIEMLEALRPQSGATHTVSYEKLNASTLDWRTSLVAQHKGVDPASLKLRISYTPTGLLDAQVLESALRRIRDNAGAP